MSTLFSAQVEVPLSAKKKVFRRIRSLVSPRPAPAPGAVGARCPAAGWAPGGAHWQGSAAHAVQLILHGCTVVLGVNVWIVNGEGGCPCRGAQVFVQGFVGERRWIGLCYGEQEWVGMSSA